MIRIFFVLFVSALGCKVQQSLEQKCNVHAVAFEADLDACGYLFRLDNGVTLEALPHAYDLKDNHRYALGYTSTFDYMSSCMAADTIIKLHCVQWISGPDTSDCYTKPTIEARSWLELVIQENNINQIDRYKFQDRFMYACYNAEKRYLYSCEGQLLCEDEAAWTACEFVDLLSNPKIYWRAQF